MNTQNLILAFLAATLIAIVAIWQVEDMTEYGTWRKWKAWIAEKSDQVYDLLLIPVARIHSASGHPSLTHVAKHSR